MGKHSKIKWLSLEHGNAALTHYLHNHKNGAQVSTKRSIESLKESFRIQVLEDKIAAKQLKKLYNT